MSRGMVAERLGESKRVTVRQLGVRGGTAAEEEIGRDDQATTQAAAQLRQAISDAPGALPGGTGARAHVRLRTPKRAPPPART